MSNQNDCKDSNGNNCFTDTNNVCTDFSLVDSQDNCLIETFVEESINLASADINIFKMLGIHEQGKLVDLAKNGMPISGGYITGFDPFNVFFDTCKDWRSLQKGNDVIKTSFIGYDFGEIKLPNGRNQYGIDTRVKQHITKIGLKQSSLKSHRVTKLRVERSQDGLQWFGVDIITIIDDDKFNLYSIKNSLASRYWRLRPLSFNGGVNDFWIVEQLELIDYDSTELNNIQDKIFLENRDREYSKNSIRMKAFYELLDVQTELSKLGIELPSQIFTLQISFNSCISNLGRPLVIGDIIEIPSEAQYNPLLEKILKYLEVTDVSWATNGYTPGWRPTLLKITAQPMLATQETQDIFGGLGEIFDSTGFFTNDKSKIQNYGNITDAIKAAGDTLTPEVGEDVSGIYQFSEEQIQSAKDQGFPYLDKLNYDATGLYVEDGLPKNGEPYTEGEVYPTNPKHGDYHRLTFDSADKDLPARLHRWSSAKNRWILCEVDKRKMFDSGKLNTSIRLKAKNKSESLEQIVKK